jgi:SAM-dependent methyltransferase
MLPNEAKWIGKQIPKLQLNKNMTVLNFGSQTVSYNNRNTFIIENIIDPIKQVSSLKNLDLQDGEGIDYTGDIIRDQVFFEKLRAEQFDVILLCNVLEHVTDIQTLTNRVIELVRPGGFIIFSGPFEYPKHFDPIDNGFRPSIPEVHRYFTGFTLIASDIVNAGTYKESLLSNPSDFVLTVIRTLLPFYKFDKWREVVLPKWYWWNKEFKVTCLLMQKGN